MKKILSLLLVSFVLSACTSGGSLTSQRWTQRIPAENAPRSLSLPGEYQQEGEDGEAVPLSNEGLGPYADRDLAALTGQAAQQLEEGEYVPPVKVAILLPLSGESAALGQSMLQAAQLALFDLGANTFELLPRDTKGTPQGASEAAQQALDNGATLILGPLFSSSVKAVKPVAARARVNVIAFSTDWTLAGGNTFLMGFMPFAQVDRIASYAATRGLTRIALITTTDTYGMAVERSLRDSTRYNGVSLAHTIRLAPEAVYNFNVPDVQALQASGAQAVMIAIGGQQAAHISFILEEAGLDAATLPRLGTGLWDDPTLAVDPTLQGAQFAAPSPVMRQKFEHNYSAVYGTAPIRLASLAYDATALAAVLGKTGQIDQYTGQYQPAFTGVSLKNKNGFSGIDGIFRFTQRNLVQRGLSVLEFQQNQIIEVDPAPDRF